MKPQSVSIYHGPSMIDSKPIRVILTGFKRPSTNPKTGAMIQVYIMRADISPLEAIESSGDRSVCGDCIHRPANLGSCYVRIFQGPRSVYAAHDRGNIPTVTPTEASVLLGGRSIRLGAYGDPAAVPYGVWNDLLAPGRKRRRTLTGYTHQWKTCDPKYQLILMASTDTPRETAQAQAKGWRTFRVRPLGTPVLPGEVPCANVRDIQCDECGLCCGLSITAKSVTIEAHGATAPNYERSQQPDFMEVKN